MTKPTKNKYAPNPKFTAYINQLDEAERKWLLGHFADVTKHSVAQMRDVMFPLIDVAVPCDCLVLTNTTSLTNFTVTFRHRPGRIACKLPRKMKKRITKELWRNIKSTYLHMCFDTKMRIMVQYLKQQVMLMEPETEPEPEHNFDLDSTKGTDNAI